MTPEMQFIIQSVSQNKSGNMKESMEDIKTKKRENTRAYLRACLSRLQGDFF